MIEGKSIHDTLREVVQRIWDEAHVRVDAIRIDWMNLNSTSELRQMVEEVRVDTTTFGRVASKEKADGDTDAQS